MEKKIINLLMNTLDKSKEKKIQEWEIHSCQELYMRMLADNGKSPDFKKKLQELETKLGTEFPHLFVNK